MQSVSSSILTRVAVSISYGDNDLHHGRLSYIYEKWFWLNKPWLQLNEK